MRSEMRSAARALVEDRRETFEAPLADAAMRARLAAALQPLGPPRTLRFQGEWTRDDERDVFVVAFAPTERAGVFLKAISIGLALLVAASAWVVYAGERPALKFLVLLFTGLAILAFPLVVAALGSARQAEESRIRRVIRRTLGIDAKENSTT